MKIGIYNKSTRDLSKYDQLTKDLIETSSEKLGWDEGVKIVFLSDPENGERPLGKTAFYIPSSKEIVVFVDNRHIKDMLRSLSHELVHHLQNCEDRLEVDGTKLGYAQGDGEDIEREAYEKGNMVFRVWEDNLKKRKEQDLYSGRLNENFQFNPF